MQKWCKRNVSWWNETWERKKWMLLIRLIKSINYGNTNHPVSFLGVCWNRTSALFCFIHHHYVQWKLQMGSIAIIFTVMCVCVCGRGSMVCILWYALKQVREVCPGWQVSRCHTLMSPSNTPRCPELHPALCSCGEERTAYTEQFLKSSCKECWFLLYWERRRGEDCQNSTKLIVTD